MEKILYFDICAIPIFILILITVFVRKMTHGVSNKLFIFVIFMNILCDAMDLLCEGLCASLPMSDVGVFFANFAMYIYLICRNATTLLYLFFIFAITRTWYRVKSTRMQQILMIPFCVVLLVLASNLFTGQVFTISPTEGYIRGPHLNILYIISMMYAFAGTVYLIFCRKFVRWSKIIPLLSLYVLSLGAVAIQYFYPQYLVEMIGMAGAFIIIVLFLLRPEELSDSSVGSLSYEAYRGELYKILMNRQKVQIVIIAFTNAVELRAYLGEERYLNYVSHVIRQVFILLKRESVDFEIYFEHPGNLYMIIDNTKYDVKNAVSRLGVELRTRSEIAAASGERIVPKVCCIHIPDDVSDYGEILRIGHEFSSQMPSGRIYADASEIISSRDYRIVSNMDLILNRAISENSFEMYYQPIYSVEQKKFISAEALIRLKDPEFGFVSPGLFIPAAESRGVILPIGDFVLEDVHRFISENDLESLGLEYIEINLSVAQCFQDDLPAKLRSLQNRYGVTPDRINLEITETTYDSISKVMDDNLKELSAMGYTFSLDDYGTGYSNMQRVSRLPLKIIKLDKSLVDEMASKDGKSIMRNTVKMMRDIEKELVAEGVETGDDLDALKSMGCHFIQGYYFSKPLPAAEFITFLMEHNLEH